MSRWKCTPISIAPKPAEQQQQPLSKTRASPMHLCGLRTIWSYSNFCMYLLHITPD